MDIEMGDTTVARPSLDSLPTELLDHVLTHLPGEDLTSLRLTARSLLHAATAVVFRTIYISPLWRDRHAFLHIAAAPHLASAVRSVVWYELAEGPASMTFFQLHRASEASRPFFEREPGDVDEVLRCNYIHNDDIDLVPRILREAVDLFWWRLPHSHFISSHAVWGTRAEFEAAEHDFFPLFVDALERMPGLLRLTSQPMPPCRDMRPAGSDDWYPFSPQLFQVALNTRDEDRNLGLKSFLLPAIGVLARREGTGGPVVRRLQFADEAIDTCLATVDTGLKLVCEALTSLTHLEMCVSSSQAMSTNVYEDCVLKVLGLTVNLTHLTLCFERYWRNDSAGAFGELLGRLPHLPKLVAIDLTNVSTPTDEFVAFIERHATTLREVRLEMCFLQPEALRGLAAISNLHLRRFVVLPHKELDEWHESFDRDVEGQILDFVNMGGGRAVEDDALYHAFTESIHTRAPVPKHRDTSRTLHGEVSTGISGPLEPELEWAKREDNAVQTHPAVYHAAGWPTAAICDSRAHNGSLYHSWHLSKLDEEAGDFRENHNTKYEQTHRNRDVEMEECNVRLVDLEDARESTPVEDPVEKAASEDGAVPVEGVSEGLVRLRVDDVGDEDDEDERPRYMREQLLYLKHHIWSPEGESPPRWLFARNPDPEAISDECFYYCQAQPGSPLGYMTETWHFRHRDGEEGWGDEPLEYWDDWEGSEAGDVTEATPYGVAMKVFLHHAELGDGWEAMWAQGAEVIKYDDDQDPWDVIHEEGGLEMNLRPGFSGRVVYRAHPMLDYESRGPSENAVADLEAVDQTNADVGHGTHWDLDVDEDL